MRVNSANAASSSDSHRLRRARRSPPRTTRDFHGISRTTAIPQIPWPMATQAPSGEPIATVATPVPKANSSTTNSAWFVWRPGGRSSIRTRLGDGRGSPLRRRITNVIRYVIGLRQRAMHESTADGDLRDRFIAARRAANETRPLYRRGLSAVLAHLWYATPILERRSEW